MYSFTWRTVAAGNVAKSAIETSNLANTFDVRWLGMRGWQIDPLIAHL